MGDKNPHKLKKKKKAVALPTEIEPEIVPAPKSKKH